MAVTLNSSGVLYNDTTTISNSVTATRAIFGFGWNGNATFLINLVNNYGAVATDTTAAGNTRKYTAAAGYGGDRAIFGYGNGTSITNRVSNVGVIIDEQSGAGTGREGLAAASYSS